MTSKEQRYSKEELLDIANSKVKKLKDYCDALEKQIDLLVKPKTPEDIKARNSTMNLYNQQVSALISCTKALIAIDKSSLENEDEENKQDNKHKKELVD